MVLQEAFNEKSGRSCLVPIVFKPVIVLDKEQYIIGVIHLVTQKVIPVVPAFDLLHIHPLKIRGKGGVKVKLGVATDIAKVRSKADILDIVKPTKKRRLGKITLPGK